MTPSEYPPTARSRGMVPWAGRHVSEYQRHLKRINKQNVLQMVLRLQAQNKKRNTVSIIKAVDPDPKRRTTITILTKYRDDELLFVDKDGNWNVNGNAYQDPEGFERRILEYDYHTGHFREIADDFRRIFEAQLDSKTADDVKEEMEVEKRIDSVLEAEKKFSTIHESLPGINDQVTICVEDAVWFANVALERLGTLKKDEFEAAENSGVPEPQVNTDRYDKLALEITEFIGEMLGKGIQMDNVNWQKVAAERQGFWDRTLYFYASFNDFKLYDDKWEEILNDEQRKWLEERDKFIAKKRQELGP